MAMSMDDNKGNVDGWKWLQCWWMKMMAMLMDENDGNVDGWKW